jgi:hypothetical protein
MGTLTNQQMGNASGVFNLMRNTGGSLGIAAMTTMLSRGPAAPVDAGPEYQSLQSNAATTSARNDGSFTRRCRNRGNSARLWGDLWDGGEAGNGAVVHRQLPHVGVSLPVMSTRCLSLQASTSQEGPCNNALGHRGRLQIPSPKHQLTQPHCLLPSA